MYLTNPTYEGLCFDVREMRAVCGERLLLIDEAHGAHFYFSNVCPDAALQGGADAAVTSAHKMLGSFYGTALINVAHDSRLDPKAILMQHLMMSAGSGEQLSPLFFLDVECSVKTFIDEGETVI